LGVNSILLMNRDERWDRKSEAIHFWPENREILAGRDCESGGTWLGISRKGRDRHFTGNGHLATS
jgi:uncharacterized protein with NRDE domain